MKLIKLVAFARANVIWLWDAKFVIASVVPVVVACAAIWRLHFTESSIRIGGLLLQLGGVAAAVLSIRGLRKTFRLVGFVDAAREWSSRRPKWSPVSVSGTGSVSAKATVQGWGYVEMQAPEGAPIADRVNALEQNYRHLRTANTRIVESMEAMKREHSAELSAAQASLRVEIGDVRATVFEAGTSGMWLTAAATVWIFFGTILGGATSEIHEFFGPASAIKCIAPPSPTSVD